MTALFEVRDLCVDVISGHLWKRHPTRLLHDLNFSVGQGNAVAYLGPNGAGKTTTFRAIFGLASHVSGKIYWKGKQVSATHLHSHIGFLPEQTYFCRVLTAREFLRGLGHLSGIDRHSLPARIERWADRLDFQHILDRPMRSCSKGQLQRVGLAQAMMHEPELLILDEPLSGLDPLGRALVGNVLKNAIAHGTSMIFSSHILADAESICDQVVALYDGRIIYDGPTRQFMADSGHWCIRVHGQHIPQHESVEIQQETDDTWLIRGKEHRYSFQDALQWCTKLHDTAIVHASREHPKLEDAFVKLIKEAKDHVA